MFLKDHVLPVDFLAKHLDCVVWQDKLGRCRLRSFGRGGRLPFVAAFASSQGRECWRAVSVRRRRFGLGRGVVSEEADGCGRCICVWRSGMES